MKSRHTNSYYAATAIGMKDYPGLRGEQVCDVGVIGGGFTGLSSALHLAGRGYKVILLEGERVGWGASGRNGGLVCTGQRKGQDDLETLLGATHARSLWDIAEAAKKTQQDLIARHSIPCDYRPGLLVAAHKPSVYHELADEVESLTHKWGYKELDLLDRAQMRQILQSDLYYGGFLDKGAGHLHPLNYALGLARAASDAGVEIYENSPAGKIQKTANGYTIYADSGVVHCRYVVVACNGYLGKLDRRMAPMIMPINNFMVATEPLGETACRELIANGAAVSDSKFVVNYFRCSSDNRLLFGGGENYSANFPADIKRFVRKYMLQVFPRLQNVALEYGWGGTLAVTVNRLPNIGRLDKDIVYAQGFSGQGVLLTTQVGKLIAEVIAGQAERFDIMASIPSPKFPGGTLLRYPGMVAGMLYYSLRDRL